MCLWNVHLRIKSPPKSSINSYTLKLPSKQPGPVSTLTYIAAVRPQQALLWWKVARSTAAMTWKWNLQVVACTISGLWGGIHSIEIVKHCDDFLRWSQNGDSYGVDWRHNPACILESLHIVHSIQTKRNRWIRLKQSGSSKVKATTSYNVDNIPLTVVLPPATMVLHISGGFRGGKVGANAPPLAASSIFLRT